MTHKQLAIETKEFYAEDTARRSMGPKQGHETQTGCYYRLPAADGTMKKCAIGRHIPDENYDPSMDESLADNIEKMIYRRGNDFLDDEVRHLDPIFLAQLQRFHDCNANWEDGKGLSWTGEAAYCDLLKFAESLDLTNPQNHE